MYDIEFLSFKIRDMVSGTQLFHVARDADMPQLDLSSLTPEEEAAVRCISYDFGPDFFKLQSIGTTLEFSVGAREVNGFRMIERHYFRERLVKSYDFNFGFCIPNSVNTWEAIYDMPPLPADLVRAAHPRTRPPPREPSRRVGSARVAPHPAVRRWNR